MIRDWDHTSVFAVDRNTWEVTKYLKYVWSDFMIKSNIKYEVDYKVLKEKRELNEKISMNLKNWEKLNNQRWVLSGLLDIFSKGENEEKIFGYLDKNRDILSKMPKIFSLTNELKEKVENMSEESDEDLKKELQNDVMRILNELAREINKKIWVLDVDIKKNFDEIVELRDREKEIDKKERLERLRFKEMQREKVNI